MASERLRAEAWIGDAVLCLFGRLRILRRDGLVDGAQYQRMASNQFLSAFGEPTAVEAELGRLYQEKGLEATFEWIEREWMPLFDRQEANRAKRRKSA
jgi:dsRNA-specific ribonuclease